jgi:hypothetical protein
MFWESRIMIRDHHLPEAVECCKCKLKSVMVLVLTEATGW